MLTRRIGAAMPVTCVSCSIVFPSGREAARITDAPFDCGGRNGYGACQMRAGAGTLPTREIAVRGRDHTPVGKAIIAHMRTERAARLMPFEAGGAEDAVEPLRLRRRFHLRRAGNADRKHTLRDPAAFKNLRCGP